jgi:amino acid transporter
MPDDVRTRPRSAAPVAGGQEAADAHDLAGFGYKQELKRILGVYSSFAVAFSYISPSTGIFTLFAPIGLAIAGPFFFWSWPIVALGQFIIALNFAEVSSHFPVAGSVYQWTKYLSNRAYSWMTGWVYLFAGILTVTGVVATVPGLVLIPLLNNLGVGIANNAQDQIIIALLVLASTTILNIFGVRLVALINNTGVVFEILGMVVFALILLIFYHHQPASVVFDSSYLGSNNQIGVFLAAMFMSLFVIYGFDTAGTLGEETRDPQRNAPRGVLWAIGLSFIAGLLFLGGTLLSIQNPAKIEGIAGGTNYLQALPTIIQDALGPFWGNVYLFVVLIAVCVCTLAIQSATIRLMFSMGRDGRLPFGRVWGSVNSTFRTPMWAGVAVAVLSALPFIVSTAIGVIVTGATGMIYLSYFLNNVASLNARLKGWPRVKAPFSLGGWGMLVNLLALIYGGLMIINFLWFGGLRNVYTNPVMGAAFPSWANIPILGGTPIFEFSLFVFFVIGAIYWFGFKRRSIIDSGEQAAEALAE